MATVTYNGLFNTNAENTISLTGMPNILQIHEANSGRNAKVTIGLDLTKVSSGREYDLVINGEKVLSIDDINQSVGTRFYLTNSSSSKNFCIFKLCQALRNLATLPINYQIYPESNSAGTYTGNLIIEAKQFGPKFNITTSGTLITSGIASVSNTAGTTSSTLASKTSKIEIDVYKSDVNVLGSAFDKGEYVTSLQKEFWSDDCYFNLSPLLSSLSEYGKLNKINLYIYQLTDNNISQLTSFSNLFFTPGYAVNQGVDYIPKFSNYYLAQNVSRGEKDLGTLNKSILYVYEPHINLSLYKNNSASSITCTINYISSGQTVIGTENYSVVSIANTSMLDMDIPLNETQFNKAFYVSISIPNLGTLKYNVIKPLKATEEGQRVYWRNSYGGVSFFDFTGERTEQRKTNVEYYQKQIFDYYEKNGETQLNNVYDKDVTITVTLNSHNIEKDGQWILFDLQNSKQAWTEINGKLYYITITDIKITEQGVPNIYEASISYTYNTGDTF